MLPTQDIIQNARSSGATLHSVAKALEMEPTELADALRLPADVVRQTTVSDEVQHRLHEVRAAFLVTAELHESDADAAQHFRLTPIRVLGHRTMLQTVADGDLEKVLRYLRTISGGQNG